MAITEPKVLDIRLLSADDMKRVKQPDGIEWPTDSICICAFDEEGNLKGRVGMIALPHMEGFWVAHDQLATGLAEALAAKLEGVLKNDLGRTSMLTFVFEKATGLAKTLEKNGWKDLGLKVFQKEL
jgi:hypothetical protein